MKDPSFIGIMMAFNWKAILIGSMLLTGTYISQDDLDKQINSKGYERDITISPDGKELFFTRKDTLTGNQVILVMRKNRSGKWSDPDTASFSGKYNDLEPFIAPNGNQLFFASNRPWPGKTGNDFDIWVVDKSQSKWLDPRPLGNAINSSGDEYYPSVSKNGNLYFTAERSGGVGKEDIYCAKWKNGNWEPALPLDTGVNTATYEFNAFIAPDESYILFSSYGRPDDVGRGDLYVSKRNPDGSWQSSIHLKELNSPQLDYCPSISPDGKTLFFTSERLGKKNGNIFMLPLETLKFQL